MKSNELKASDLRIGNYLQDREGRLCIVTAVTKETDPLSNEDFKAPTLKGPVTSLPHSPIPLTEEILVRLGFYPDKPKEWYEKAGITLGWITTDENFEFEYNRTVTPVQLKYVHQLQNLYFALTGEELTLKEI